LVLSKSLDRALTAHRLLSHFRAIYLLWESRLYEDVGAVSLIDSSGILTERWLILINGLVAGCWNVSLERAIDEADGS